ncbi:MAG TPA: LUD domain-containing protein [Anaerolineae bacterium]|nr:LUD domain-containing protein [Anaerolineae bacterium]
MAHDFQRRAAAALEDDFLRTTLTRSTGILRQQRASAIADTTPFNHLQAEARSVRMAALGRLPELLEQLDSRARANGMEVFWAEDAAAANRYLLALAEARRVRQVVRSHSAVVEEIGLDATLAAAGVGVVLTQVGDYIVQLSGDDPSHMVYPALHQRKEDVADLFEAKLDVPKTLDIQALASMVRFKLRRPILESTLSVSGVAFGVAETGTLVLTSDSGDDRFTLAASPVHVAIMGIEQVVARLDDLALLLALGSRSASGQPLASYTTWLNGPMPAGAPDGPRDLHLILLDNGRSDLLRWGYGEALACIRCGACQNACPVYREIGGQAYSSRGSGPIDSVFLPLLPVPPNNHPAAGPLGVKRPRQRAGAQPGTEPSPPLESPPLRGAPFADLPRASTLCGACADVCPVGIDIPRLLVRLRGDLVEAGQSGFDQRLLRRAYRWGMADPGRYRRLHRWLRRGNLLRRWPQPAAQTFRERWQARRSP